MQKRKSKKRPHWAVKKGIEKKQTREEIHRIVDPIIVVIEKRK